MTFQSTCGLPVHTGLQLVAIKGVSIRIYYVSVYYFRSLWLYAYTYYTYFK